MYTDMPGFITNAHVQHNINLVVFISMFKKMY